MTVGIRATGWRRRRKIKRSVCYAIPSAKICFYPDYRRAMKVVENKHCDVVMFEIRDGTDLFTIRYLREHYPRMNIIVYSEDGKYALDLINMGVSGYITEPLTREKVKEQMEHLRYA